jgi:glycine cleavage system T protein (aminomethyltransferase)
MNRSPLHDLHAELGARFVDFGGWEMPVQYESVLAEHRAVREHVGWFDVSHLGRFELAGPGALQALSRLLCNDIERISVGQTQYSMLLNEDGGIVDDLIVWRLPDDRFWVLPNAANHQRVMSLFEVEPECQVRDLQLSTVMLAVQGPEAPGLLEALTGVSLNRSRVIETTWDAAELTMAGTGYTGERGGEICVDAATADLLARALIELGAAPCGLGARDTLRLEAGLALWGSDIDETTTPLEAGLAFALAMDHDFVGRDALETQKSEGVSRKLTGFVLDDRGIPRHDYEIRSGESRGRVTSGNLSPILGRGIGLAYLAPPAADGPVEVSIRDRWVPGHLARPPFHRSPT